MNLFNGFISKMLYIFSRLPRLRKYYQYLGFHGMLRFFFADKFLNFYIYLSNNSKKYIIYRMYARNLNYPIYCRINSTDKKVFWQIFVRRDYDYILKKPPQFIIDCGAYVGYSTSYFLSIYPNSRIVAIEPDWYNYQLLMRNMLPYKDRVDLIHAGIWNKNIGLKIDDSQRRDKGEWAIKVRQCLSDEKPDIIGITIEQILKNSIFNKIDILKIDIEGAEKLIFEDSQNWIDKVDTIFIELHGNSCQDSFINAIGLSGFSYRKLKSTTIAIRN